MRLLKQLLVEGNTDFKCRLMEVNRITLPPNQSVYRVEHSGNL